MQEPADHLQAAYSKVEALVVVPPFDEADAQAWTAPKSGVADDVADAQQFSAYMDDQSTYTQQSQRSSTQVSVQCKQQCCPRLIPRSTGSPASRSIVWLQSPIQYNVVLLAAPVPKCVQGSSCWLLRCKVFWLCSPRDLAEWMQQGVRSMP